MSQPQQSLRIRVAPFISVLSVGYVLFAYASVPQLVTQRFSVNYVSIGLLMSIVLFAFTVVQFPGGFLIDRISTRKLLVIATGGHSLLAVSLDLVRSFELLLLLRMGWGLLAGIIVTAGAAHFATIFHGATVTRYQGAFGGMLTFGGALAFLCTPSVVARTGWIGVHAVGSILAIPALLLFLTDERAQPATAGNSSTHVSKRRNTESPSRASGTSESNWLSSAVNDRLVVLAGFCYVATLSGYVTLSTFITGFFEDLGVLGPLNAAVLLMAAVGRTGGGFAAGEWSVDDRRLIIGATLAAAAGFLLMTQSSGWLLLVLPLITMIAVSGPFGSIFNLASATSTSTGHALSIVVAMGNFASLLFPPITGLIREETGGYAGAFLLLAGLNGIAALAILVSIRHSARVS